jgi:hypothetical protein
VLDKGGLVEVSVAIDTQDMKAGVYKGKIAVHAENAADIDIPLKVEVSQPSWVAFLFNFVGVLLGCALVAVGITVNSQDQGKSFRVKANNLFIANLVENVDKQIVSVAAFFLVTAVLMITTFIAFYPKIVAFGANPLFDYATAVLFGVSQVGASKMAADLFKKATP